MTNDLQVSQRAREAAADLAPSQRHFDLLKQIDDEYAAHMGDPYGHDDYHAAREAAATVIAKFERDLLAEREVLREALEKARGTLENYADPTAYTDANGEQLAADAECHPGLLAAETLAIVSAALKDNQP